MPQSTSDVAGSQGENTSAGTGKAEYCSGVQVGAGPHTCGPAPCDSATPLFLIHGHNCGQFEPSPPKYPESSEWDDALGAVDTEIRKRDAIHLANVRIAEALDARRCSQDAAKLSACGSWLLFRAWAQNAAVRLREANFCSLTRACVSCAAIRAARTADVYTAKSLVLLDQAFERGEPIPVPRMVTVTQPVGPDFELQLSKMLAALKKLRQLRNNAKKRGTSPEWSRPEHFAWSVECKRSRNYADQWHIHAHSVCLCSQRLDLDRLHHEWTEMTGWAGRPDVRLSDSGREILLRRDRLRLASVRDALRHDLMEVFKYNLKFSDLTPDDIAHAFLATRGKRLLFGWDGYRGCKVPEELGDLAEEAGPWMDLHFRRLSGRARLFRHRFGDENGVGCWSYQQ